MEDQTELFSSENYNFNFRPISFFDPEDPITELLVNMKGEARRKWLKQALNEGKIPPADFLLRENLKDGERALLGKLNPTFMGGEYLPDREKTEVEIARFVLDSTTQDVISIRARNCRTKITYFVVDEYNTNFICQLDSSTEPFTFGELIKFLSNIYCEEFDLRGITACCRANFDIGDCLDLEQLEQWRGFISAESEFYPQIQNYFKEETNVWIEACALDIINTNKFEGAICLQ